MLPTYEIPTLPPSVELETGSVLRVLARASRELGELKGRAGVIPNPGILIDTLSLQEAKASSEVENIVTTQDELYQATLFPEGPTSPAAKEVARYREAIKLGFKRMQEEQGLILNRHLIEVYQLLKNRQDGFRETPGTALKNDHTGEIVYVPPQDANQIRWHMENLERFINDDQACDLDPQIKMAVIHHQFESIHPFPDGSGRIGRMLNVLYLTRCGLLDAPILYLSRYITQHKAEYYRLLQAVRDEGIWEDWVLFMLEAVEKTSRTTVLLINEIGELMMQMKHRMRDELPRIYSQDLLNNLFRHPYTRIDFVKRDLQVTRQTASHYLDQLVAHGFLQKVRAGRHNYYINTELVRIFMRVSGS